jgi:ribosome biogenesis GTPase
MSPKYSGGSDEWLDDEQEGYSGRGPSARPTAGQTAGFLPVEQGNATVVEVFIGQCRARPDGGEPELLASYRRAGVLGSGGGTGRTDVRERAPVAVGDRILLRGAGSARGVVEGICTRRNALARHAAGRETQQVIAANLDGLVVVASAEDPAFSPGLVDRYRVAASHAHIPPLLCITKIDLLAPGAARPWERYGSLGMELHLASSTTGVGVDALRERLRAGAYAFCGQSGVGKTSLLAALLGKSAGRVGAVSAATHKGRHTTTHAILLPGPPGSAWIDTPGVREFGLQGITPETLRNHFPEFAELPCSRGRCLHDGEPDCNAEGIPSLESYRRILASLREEGS